MIKVGDKVRVINRSVLTLDGLDFHSYDIWEIVTVTELLPEYPGAIHCENDKGKRQWLLPQHYELLVETDMNRGNMLVRSIRAESARRESQRELVKGFTLIGIIPIIMSYIVYLSYLITEVLL